jgi:predicted nucleic acid-binding protein
MTAYLDSSALTAWFDPGNPHCQRVLAWRQRHSPVEFAWNRILQLECGHYFRRAAGDYADTARQAFNQAEAARRFHVQTLNPLALMQAAERLSRKYGEEIKCGFWDLCHLAAAARDGLLFATADRKQFAAAELVGLEAVYLGPSA